MKKTIEKGKFEENSVNYPTLKQVEKDIMDLIGDLKNLDYEEIEERLENIKANIETIRKGIK